MTVVDDLGAVVARPVNVERIVSLVPSLTESIEFTRPGSIVAATEWCSYPADLDVRRIRGTKNPDCRAIIDMRPDLVIANKEENRAIDIERLRTAGINVWVTNIESVADALTSMGRLFTDALDWPIPQWLDMVRKMWREPAPESGIRVAIPIWRDPWMVVGSRTFTGDLITHMGWSNVFSDSGERYPKVELDQLDSRDIDVILLPDEPYVFTETDGPEAFRHVTPILVSGRLLTWYGPSLLIAQEELAAAMDQREQLPL
jgi:ABC-type Fe3+-hydroxamate transport system substrate-binding protein